MRIALASDHAGFDLKDRIAAHLAARHECLDLGPYGAGRVDYPDFAEKVGRAIAAREADLGILICGSGIGISIAANKIPGVRAALCGDPGTAAGARVWNHANVICLSNRTLSPDMAREILAAWYDTAPGDRGAAGVALLRALEARHLR